MRYTDCPTCAAAADRSGELLHAMTRTAHRLHIALRHYAQNVAECREPVCVANFAIIEGRRPWIEQFKSKPD